MVELAAGSLAVDSAILPPLSHLVVYGLCFSFLGPIKYAAKRKLSPSSKACCLPFGVGLRAVAEGASCVENAKFQMPSVQRISQLRRKNWAQD